MPPLDPSNKRFLSLLMGLLGAGFSTKLGISEELALAMVSLVGGYFLTSKAGEVLVAQAEAKGVVAAAGVTTLEQANAIIAKALADAGLTPIAPPAVPPVAPAVPK
jgi:hypothetical protein